MAGNVKDLYARFELQVRTPKKRILLDSFLPAPESLASAVAPSVPAPLPVPEMSVEEMNMYRRREPEEAEEQPDARPRAAKKKTAKKKKDEPAARSLQEEIADFMGRDGAALAPEDDLTSALNTALDGKDDKGTGR